MNDSNDLFKNLAEAGISPVVMLLIFIILIFAIYIIIRNIIEKKNESRRRIKVMSNMDDLTHLYKRRFFDTLIEAELVRATRHDRNLSCAIIAIDNTEEIKNLGASGV